MIRPLRRVHRGKRTHALAMLILGLAAMYAISRTMPHTQAGVPAARDLRGGVEAGVPAARDLRGGVEAGVPAARGWRGGVEAGDRRYLIDEAIKQRAERAS